MESYLLKGLCKCELLTILSTKVIVHSFLLVHEIHIFFFFGKSVLIII